MIEILREPPQSAWVLTLFLVIVLLYVFLYINDSRRLVYFFKSAFNKQYQVNYGRQSIMSQHFMVLLSIPSILVASLLLCNYLSYCSNAVTDNYAFIYSSVTIVVFLGVKWLSLFMASVLFKQQKLFREFLSISTQYANLFFSPILIISLYVYLSADFSLKNVSLIVSISLVSLACGKMSAFTHMRKEGLFDSYYFILYFCTFEVAPFLWLLIGLDC